MLRIAVAAVVLLLLAVLLRIVLVRSSETPAGSSAPKPAAVVAPQVRPELDGAPTENRKALPGTVVRASEPVVESAEGGDLGSPNVLSTRSHSVTVLGRALNIERVPLANAVLDCFIAAIGIDGGRTVSRRVATAADDRGVFSARIDLGSGFEAARCKLVVLAQDPRPLTQALHTDEVCRGLVEIAVRPEGTCDAGDVVLEPTPQVLGGIVVNEQGAPVPTILVSVVDREGSRGLPDESFGDLQPVSTGKDGRFVIASWTRSQDLSIRIDHRDYRPVILDHLRPPQLDLRIILFDSGTASIRFSLLVDEECGGDLHGRAVRTDVAPEASRPFRSYAGAERGQQVIRPIDAGEYRLEIFDGSTGIVVDRIDGLHVTERRACDDSRLNPIDLRGRFGCARASLVDADGRPLAHVWLTIRSGAWESRVYSDKNGFISIPNSIASPEVDAVDKDGCVTPIVNGARIVTHGVRQPRD